MHTGVVTIICNENRHGSIAAQRFTLFKHLLREDRSSGRSGSTSNRGFNSIYDNSGSRLF